MRMASDSNLALNAQRVRAAGCANSHSSRRTQALPRRMRALLRLPAFSLWPGQMPSHEASRSTLPKLSMSAPISTSSMAAPRGSLPGMVCNSSDCGS
jgi:hypothetical protein